MKRFGYLFAAGLLFLSSATAFAQSNGGNGNGNGQDVGGSNASRGNCTQTTGGGGGATSGGAQGVNASNSSALLTGVIDAAVQDVQALNNINAPISALNGANVQVVCLNDALNQNDLHVLQGVLDGSPILSGDLNHSLNNNNVLNDLLQGSNIALLNNVQVVAVNLDTGQVFLMRQA
jgi:hypothetical protein